MPSVLELWSELYPDEPTTKLDALIHKATAMQTDALEPLWWKHAVVYSLYVEKYTPEGTFDGLIEKLDHLSDLGVTCIWLLPVLESPMKDAGFDISDYDSIREELGGNAGFKRFSAAAKEHDIKIVFDVALNHVSDQHAWFQDALAGGEYRNWFHWSDWDTKYPDARLLFKGMVSSNWEPTGDGDFYFHRFYPFQPDLNYANPDVLVAMIEVLLGWVERGIDGFRADAIPFLWKQEGTNCEGLPETHLILKLIRGVLDLARPNTLLLAEACLAPEDVVDFFGDGDECNAAYHFPLMPRMWLAMAEGDVSPIRQAMIQTPPIPPDCGWWVFLRLHDELTLEFLSEDEMDRLRHHYLRDPSWSFRSDEGISARLATLVDEDPRKIIGLFAMLLTVGGTPVVYFGDEVAAVNDPEFYEQATEETGWADSRFLVRAPYDWQNRSPVGAEVFAALKKMLSIREVPATPPTFVGLDTRLYAVRRDNHVIVVNLTDETIDLPDDLTGEDLLAGDTGPLAPYATRWMKIEHSI